MPLQTIPQEDSAVLQKEAPAKRILDSIPLKIGVHSGKGGVGKSTVAVNLAAALAKIGRNVLLLDADIDCPAAAAFLGIDGTYQTEQGRLIPFSKHGLYVLSTAFLLQDSSTPLVFRGPAKHHLLIELLIKARLPNLDCMVIDLPPGTSDIPLTVMKMFSLDYILFVTTPQKPALIGTSRSIYMAKKLNLRILGLIENMSGETFGEGKAKELAAASSIPFLFSIPLSASVNASCEAGKPAVLEDKGLFKKFSSIVESL